MTRILINEIVPNSLENLVMWQPGDIVIFDALLPNQLWHIPILRIFVEMMVSAICSVIMLLVSVSRGPLSISQRRGSGVIESLNPSSMNTIRCPWCGSDPLYIAYHDEEWGVPVHEDRKLFEFLTLEGAQAGLSWITILRKREHYRRIFHHWDIEKISYMRDAELENILLDSSIIRNRLKVYSVRRNAEVALVIQKEFGSLDAYFWHFIASLQRGIPLMREGDFVAEKNPQSSPSLQTIPLKRSSGLPLINHPQHADDFIGESDISHMISKDLKKRGMSFVGPTIIYAFMQATGMVDDHLDSCFRKRAP